MSSDYRNIQSLSAGHVEQVKRRNKEILFTAPFASNLSYRQKVVETASLLSASEYRSDMLIGHTKNLLGYLKNLIRKSCHYKVLHLFYMPSMSLLLHVLPVLIIGRFFGCQVVFDNRNITRFDIWHNMSFLFRRLVKMFTAVMVLSDYQKLVMADLNVASVSIPESVSPTISKAKVIKDLQPKILVKVENKKLHNLKYLFSAYELVKQKYPRCEMVVAVDKPETFNFKLNGVSYVTPETAALDTEIDLFVNCTRFDYLSSAILDAMNIGLPVISTPVTMIDKFKNRENILFYRYHDHSALADRVIELIENSELCQKLSEQGPKTAAQFSPEKMSVRWHKFYSKILS